MIPKIIHYCWLGGGGDARHLLPVYGDVEGTSWLL
jgi:hypothetical protein